MNGEFPARATGKFQFGHSAKGTEQVGVQYRISEGEHVGVVLTWYGFFNTDANTERALRTLRTSGWRGDDLLTLGGLGETAVTVVVEEEEYQGRISSKIKWVNAPGVAMKNGFDDGAKRVFAARLRGAVIASRTTAPSSTGGAAAAPPASSWDGYGSPPGTSDDIPF